MEQKDITAQQVKLTLGIVELKRTYRYLKELSFSGCVLGQLFDIIDDLEGLLEDENAKKIVREV